MVDLELVAATPGSPVSTDDYFLQSPSGWGTENIFAAGEWDFLRERVGPESVSGRVDDESLLRFVRAVLARLTPTTTRDQLFKV